MTMLSGQLKAAKADSLTLLMPTARSCAIVDFATWDGSIKPDCSQTFAPEPSLACVTWALSSAVCTRQSCASSNQITFHTLPCPSQVLCTPPLELGQSCWGLKASLECPPISAGKQSYACCLKAKEQVSTSFHDLTCFTVMAGFHPLSALTIDRHTKPVG